MHLVAACFAWQPNSTATWAVLLGINLNKLCEASSLWSEATKPSAYDRIRGLLDPAILILNITF